MENILKQLGLSEKEATVYKSLLERGASTASSLANSINLPRQTVYSILQKLCDDGFVEKGLWRGAHKFFVDPTNLSSVVRSKQKELTKVDKEVQEIIPKLLDMTRTYNKKKPAIQYYDGVFGLKRLFDEIIEQFKHKEDTVFRGVGINYFKNTTIQDTLYDFVRERYKYGVETRLIIAEGENDFGITDNPITKLGREIRQMKFEPQNAGAFIVGKRVYLFSYEDEVGIMIEQEVIIGLLKKVFDLEWDRAKELDRELRKDIK